MSVASSRCSRNFSPGLAAPGQCHVRLLAQSRAACGVQLPSRNEQGRVQRSKPRSSTSKAPMLDQRGVPPLNFHFVPGHRTPPIRPWCPKIRARHVFNRAQIGLAASSNTAPIVATYRTPPVLCPPPVTVDIGSARPKRREAQYRIASCGYSWNKTRRLSNRLRRRKWGKVGGRRGSEGQRRREDNIRRQ